ncbi:MAG: hypothetical protein JJT77_01105 [Crocinitomicaceae bacterium]|nr:hypothetical protein [Crocinitomicaceae bacterium]
MRLLLSKILFFTFIAACTIGCTTKVKLFGDFERRPVVHFIIDPSDEYHFMRLHRTFIGEGDALDFAKVPDSSYFPLEQVNAIVQEIDIQQNILREWQLKDTVTSNKREGVFFYPEQRLYYFKANDLNRDNQYRLIIDINDGEHKVEGRTRLIRNMSITTPAPLDGGLTFANANVPLNGYRNQPIRFIPGTAVMFNVRLRFFYRERTANGTEIKSIPWNIGSINSSDITSGQGMLTANGQTFYELLRMNIPIDNQVIRREVHGMEILLTGGSQDLQTYMLANQPTNSLTQNRPEFSNLSGALGIFTARESIRIFKTENPPQTNFRALNSFSTRELANGPFTVQLNFCSGIPLDQSSDFSCN